MHPEHGMTSTDERVRASFRAQTLMQTLGAELVHVADGEVHIALSANERVLQQHGFVHAGAITSVVDSACGYAALTKAPTGFEVVTVEFKVNFPRPAIGTRFLAIGKVVSAGKLLTVCTGEVHAISEAEGASKIVALMQATICNVGPPRG
jgi:uncharacterized protein (TIGR00369 family)